jgi:hypothetical protein
MDETDIEEILNMSMNTSAASYVRHSVNKWMAEKLKKLGCHSTADLTAAKCKVPLKDDLAQWLHGALLFMNRQNEEIRHLTDKTALLKDGLIDSQRSVVRLQEQLLASKDEHLLSLQNTVKSSVQSIKETVKEELKTYSSAVTRPAQVQTLSPLLLNNVVKQVVEQEDRSRNLMIFGLPEDSNDSETLKEKVADMFAVIGEKPRVEVTRLGKANVDNGQGRPRPVKVTLSSSATAHQLLMKARELKTSEVYRKTFICPDLSQEQRTERRVLVAEQKRRAVEQPSMKHFIRGGRVQSVEKLLDLET